MKVMDYVSGNLNKASYTVCVIGKSYLCNAEEAIKVFGDYAVKKVTFRNGNGRLSILHL